MRAFPLAADDDEVHAEEIGAGDGRGADMRVGGCAEVGALPVRVPREKWGRELRRVDFC